MQFDPPAWKSSDRIFVEKVGIGVDSGRDFGSTTAGSPNLAEGVR